MAVKRPSLLIKTMCRLNDAIPEGITMIRSVLCVKQWGNFSAKEIFSRCCRNVFYEVVAKKAKFELGEIFEQEIERIIASFSAKL